MSDPAWIGAGRGDSVGTATITTDGTFTIVGHGLDDGTPAEVDALTGGAVGVLREDSSYFVVNAATDTFQLVSTSGDQIITFGSTGGADVYTRVPHMLAIELRRLDSGLLTKDGDRFGARQGIHPACDPAVTVSGTTWTVENIVGVVYPAETSTSGPYRFAHPEESGSLDPPDGAQPRIDALYLQLQDNDEDGSGFRRAHVVYAAGDPAADPDPPDQVTEAPNSLQLALIDVPAGGTPSPSIRDTGKAQFTVAAGGVLPVRDADELPSSGLYDGFTLWRQDHKRLEIRDTTAGVWRHVYAGGWVVIEKDSFSGTPPFTVDLTQGGKWPAGTFSEIYISARGSVVSSPAHITLRVNGDTTSDLHESAWIRRNAGDGSVSNSDRAAALIWRIGRWGTQAGNSNLQCRIFHTDVSNILSFESQSKSLGSTAAVSFTTDLWGSLTESRLLSSLRFSTFDAGSDISAFDYKVLGLIA